MNRYGKAQDDGVVLDDETIIKVLKKDETAIRITVAHYQKISTKICRSICYDFQVYFEDDDIKNMVENATADLIMKHLQSFQI